MEMNIIQNDAAADQLTAPWSDNPFLSLSQLPTELLVGIIKLSLPEVDPKWHFALSYYMKRLYIMRSVTKRWQAVIEGTPAFWTTIAFNLPSHVNEASILRSSNHPLTILCYNSSSEHPKDGPSVAEFLKFLQHTRSRWSTLILHLYDQTTISSYLEAPSPFLQRIVVKSSCRSSEPLELLGGETSNLRSVELSRVSISWRTGCFTQLKWLKLKDVTHNSPTAQPLLDVLRASPGLQVLKLTRMNGTDIPQPSPTITLHHLYWIKIKYCDIGLVECILGRIQAPSCTMLELSIGDEPAFDVPHFLDKTLKSFHPVLRKLHRLHGGSEVMLDSRELEWRTPNYWNREGFSICIDNLFDPLFTDWVDRTLKDEPGPWIIFGIEGTSSEAVLRSIAPMRRVTNVIIGGSWHRVDVSSALQFLSKPLTTSPSLPSLPCLQTLYVPSEGWDIRDLLEMVQLRFCTLDWEAMERTPLTIIVNRWARGGPGLLVDLATLVNIRKTSGVKRFHLGGRKHPEGTLAVVWNDEASEAVWV